MGVSESTEIGYNDGDIVERSGDPQDASDEPSGAPQDASDESGGERQDVAKMHPSGAVQDESLFVEIGGFEGIQAIVGHWNMELAQDPRVSHFFLRTDIAGMTKGIENLFSSLVGAPDATSLTSDESALTQIHAHLNLTFEDYDALLDCCVRAMDMLEIDPEIQAKVLRLWDSKKNLVMSDKAVVVLDTENRGGKSSVPRGHSCARSSCRSSSCRSSSCRSSRKGDDADEGITSTGQQQHLRPLVVTEKANVIEGGGNMEGKMEYMEEDPSPPRPDLCQSTIFDRTLKAQYKKFRSMYMTSFSYKLSSITTNSFASKQHEVEPYEDIYQDMGLGSDYEHEDLLMDRLGGVKAISTVITQLHYLNREDKRLGEHFNSFGARFLIQHHKHVLAAALGKTEIQFGHSLGGIHANLGITDYEFEALVDNVGKAIRMCGAADELADEMMLVLRGLRPRIVASSNEDKDVNAHREDDPYVYDLEHFFVR